MMQNILYTDYKLEGLIKKNTRGMNYFFSEGPTVN